MTTKLRRSSVGSTAFVIAAASATPVIPAFAQPSNTPPLAMDFAPSPPPPLRDETPKRKVWTAIGLSVGPLWAGAVAVGLGENASTPWVRNATGGFATAALVLGPSAGHWYAGRWVTPGLVLRLGAIGGAATLFLAYPKMDEGALLATAFTAVNVFGIGLFWDLLTVPRSVRKYNSEHTLGVVPLVGASTGNGVALTGSF